MNFKDSSDTMFEITEDDLAAIWGGIQLPGDPTPLGGWFKKQQCLWDDK